MKRYGYTEKKLFQYLHTLATHEGDARRWIIAAFNFTIPVLKESDFAPEDYAEWMAIDKEIRKFGPYHNAAGETIWSDIEHTMRRVRNRTASNIAKRVLELYFKIRRNEEIAEVRSCPPLIPEPFACQRRSFLTSEATAGR